MPNELVVYVLCSTRSGSTWLALMLGSNARARYVGELARMFRDDPEGCSLCTERGQFCPVFHDIESLSPANVHSELLRRTEARVLIDNSKSLSWLRKTVDREVERRAIHLLRDPRAVVYSWRRRGRTKGLDQWIEENEEIRRTLHERGIDHRIATYNRLAEDTDGTLPDLCDWLGLDYSVEQQSYWDVAHHGAGRNGATASFLNDYVASDGAFYEARARTHFHDLRWQQELDQATRNEIQRSARLADFLSSFGFVLADNGLQPLAGA